MRGYARRTGGRSSERMQLKSFVAACMLALATPGGSACAQADDMARYLAGLPLQAQSPLARLAETPAWKQHARYLDAKWAELERQQLAKVRAFARSRLGLHAQTAQYFFSGPDFAYVDALLPDAATYILGGLEAVGTMPDAQDGGEVLLARTRQALRDFLDLGFFRTEQMVPGAGFVGVVPLLHVLLARTGKRIGAVSRVAVTAEGALVSASAAGEGDVTPGVKLMFTDAQGRAKELLYFNVDLSNAGLKGSGFLAFCRQAGASAALIKSASYLLHRDRFSQVRTFLLDHATAIVQDDTGIPFRFLDNASWRVRLFGSYERPIGQFSQFHQPDIEQRARESQPEPIDFRIGYLSRVRPSHLLVAIKIAAQPR
jgi:hypothetical protein